jgi:hypothetical protein
VSTSKEFIQIANQLPVLAKAYFNHLHGTPEEVAKQQKELLKYLKSLHRQLCVKGTKMVKIVKTGSGAKSKASKPGRASFQDEEEYGCPSGMVKCPNGNCVATSSQCDQ